MSKQAIFLMGPTASGKTQLALELADALPVSIISVDSTLVYRGMDIGTGKPTRDELLRVPHQLVDICDPITPYSCARFCIDARAAMEQAWSDNKIPLLVGGTMLYFKALQFGLAELPAANEELRAQLVANGEMYTELGKLDPESAKRLNENDSQRIQRALEVNIITGKTMAENYALQKTLELDYKLHSFAIVPEDRAALHSAISLRFDQMLEKGFVNEVKQLFTRNDLHTDLPAIRSVGYRQAWSYLANEISHATMREQAIAATRQLAKRQYTWLRSWPNVTNIHNSNTKALDTIVKTVLSFVNNQA